MFSYFENTSQKERSEIARNLKKLYNRFYNEENETFLAMRETRTMQSFTEAQTACLKPEPHIS